MISIAFCVWNYLLPAFLNHNSPLVVAACSAPAEFSLIGDALFAVFKYKVVFRGVDVH